MHGKRCAVPGCETKAWLPTNTLSVFRFPKDQARRAIWVKRVNNPQLHEKSQEQLYQLRICALHFADDQFMNKRHNRLIHCAIPSLELPDVPSTDEEVRLRKYAAYKAYMKDVEANADYSSKLIKEQLAQKEREEDSAQVAVKHEVTDLKGFDVDVTVKKEPETELQVKTESETCTTKLWFEAKSDEGYTYYWHTETGESRWEPPEEGFMSLKEQKKAEERENRKKAEEERQKKLQEERQKKLEEERQKEEERARLEREKMKSRRIKEEKPPSPVEMPGPVIGPAPRADPYGAWKPVVKIEPKSIDWQLPQQEFVEIKVPSIEEPPPEYKFKEKTVKSLDVVDDDAAGSGFKKRKFNSSLKRNMRQRFDEDA